MSFFFIIYLVTQIVYHIKDSVEIISMDPDAAPGGSFSITQSTLTGNEAFVHPDGEHIFLAGGLWPTNLAVNTVQKVNVRTNADAGFAAPMISPRARVASVVLGDGRWWVTGGFRTCECQK